MTARKRPAPPSLQTRMARNAVESAKRSWNRHRGRCAACAVVVRERQDREPCEDGAKMLADLALSREVAAREAELDREPPVFGMEPLFDL